VQNLQEEIFTHFLCENFQNEIFHTARSPTDFSITGVQETLKKRTEAAYKGANIGYRLFFYGRL
jgi:hypothetical protein